MTEPVAVRTVAVADEAAVVRVLSQAFADDPVFSWIYPDPTTRARVLPGFFALFARYSAHHEVNQLAGDDVGAAIWAPPGESLVADADGEAFGTALVMLSPDDTERLMASDELFSAHHPTDPHWYLSLIGVADGHQGEGIGSAMLRDALDRADRSAMPSYLEATRPENRRLYERHGFVTTDEIVLPDGPTAYAMWRDPVI